jgi:hypothetical protein
MTDLHTATLAHGVPGRLLLDYERHIYGGIVDEWEAETAAIGRLLTSRGLDDVWRDIYRLHASDEDYTAGDELIFLLEHPAEEAEP